MLTGCCYSVLGLTLSRPDLRLFSLRVRAFRPCLLLYNVPYFGSVDVTDTNLPQKGLTDCPYRDNIRVLEMDAREAQGPCWGRHFQVTGD